MVKKVIAFLLLISFFSIFTGCGSQEVSREAVNTRLLPDIRNKITYEDGSTSTVWQKVDKNTFIHERDKIP